MCKFALQIWKKYAGMISLNLKPFESRTEVNLYKYHKPQFHVQEFRNLKHASSKKKMKISEFLYGNL
jgi:hypothetical protein